MTEKTALKAKRKIATSTIALKVLLACGIISSLFYVGADIFAAMLSPGYDYTSQQVSELSAIGAQTRPFMIAIYSVYALLVIAFGIGVWISEGSKRSLRITGIMMVAFGIIVELLVLLAPMHMRGVVGSFTDILHSAIAIVQALLTSLLIAFGAAAFGRTFRIYSIGTIMALLIFGALDCTQAPAIAAGKPTPWFGIIERVSVYSPMLWILVFAAILLGVINRPKTGNS